MGVREEDRVDAADAVGERLGAQIGRGVDQDRRRRACGALASQGRDGFDQDRRPRAFVARIRGSADLAVASDRGDTVGGAAAKNGDAKG